MEILSTGSTKDLVIMVFGAGLVTGLTIYILSHSISSALRIVKHF